MAEIIVEKATPKRLQELRVSTWLPWECEPSRFDWQYDQAERAYLLEGRVTVHAPEGKVKLQQGDLVFFPKGLQCVWEIKEKVRKVYRLE